MLYNEAVKRVGTLLYPPEEKRGNMNRIFIFLAVFLIVLAVIFGAVWFFGGQKASTPSGQNSSQSTAKDLTKSSSDTNPGNVQVDVTLVTEDNASELNAGDFDLSEQYVVYVEMNTHSVDITGYKMADISTLEVGGKTSKASEWAKPMDGGGHHANGFLVFKKTAEAKQLRLVIKGIAGIAEREFEWNL